MRLEVKPTRLFSVDGIREARQVMEANEAGGNGGSAPLSAI